MVRIMVRAPRVVHSVGRFLPVFPRCLELAFLHFPLRFAPRTIQGYPRVHTRESGVVPPLPQVVTRCSFFWSPAGVLYNDVGIPVTLTCRH
jgi:hypothetical protein